MFLEIACGELNMHFETLLFSGTPTYHLKVGLKVFLFIKTWDEKCVLLQCVMTFISSEAAVAREYEATWTFSLLSENSLSLMLA